MRLLTTLVTAAALALPAVAHAAPPAVTWCGTDEVTADRVPSLEVSSPDQVRVVYAVPAGAPDNFFAYASGIAMDAAAIDAWWQSQDPTRTVRFDRYPFAGCNSRFGDLDLGFVRLPRDASAYAPADAGPEQLDSDLAALTPPTTQKTVVYYDGPISDPRLCGETDYQAAGDGGRFGFAYVFIQSCDVGRPGSGQTAAVAAHELIHNLGAVPDEAPHVCSDSRGHVCDSEDDLLYPFLRDGETLDGAGLDIGRDDYYGHGGAWWDVQDSSWLAHLPQRELRVAVGAGGSVVASLETLDCATGCDVQLDDGVRLQLAAAPAAGRVFAGWSGACSGDDPCVLQMDGPKTVTAAFAATFALRVAVAGRGRVSSVPAGIACPGRCAFAFRGGTIVRLVARASRGSRFAGWSGACRGRGACVVRVSRAASVRAVFRR